MNSATQATNLRNVAVPGDELSYGDLTVSFMVDEDMTNYISLHTWIRKLGFPVNREEFDFEAPNTLSRTVYESDSTVFNRLIEQNTVDYNFEYSDATLQILNSNYNVVRTVKFYDCFPVSLSTLEFRADITDTQYLTAQANFKYLYFDIV